MSDKTEPKSIFDADRPSQHGRLLGSALALIAKKGREVSTDPIPDMCLTCAFREGTLPNHSAGTGLMAFNTVMGIDPDDFCCHHGMKDGKPQKLCSGYIAAKLAPFSFTKEVFEHMNVALQKIDGTDAVRAEFDAWASTLDPAVRQDMYAVGRQLERHKREQASIKVI